MKRIMKIIFGLFGALLLLLIVAAVGATLFIDPNDYRDTIAAKVQEQTGRELDIEGEIKLSLFPWLGLELGAMQMGNARGFADKPFARIEAAEARVKLLPLLKLQTQIDTVLLRGLVLNLHRRSDGVSNWDDLAKAGEKPVAEPRAEKPSSEADGEKLEQMLAALAIGGIALEEANIEWRDDLSKQRFSLKHFNFSAGAIRIGEAIPLKLSTELLSSAPEINGSLDFSGDVTADPFAQRYRAQGMKLSTVLNGKGIPGAKLEATLGGDAAVDLATQQANLQGFTLNAMGVELKLTVAGKQIIDKPSFSGELVSNEFVPRQLLSQLDITLPEMADPSVMGKAKLSTRFEGGLDQVALNGLSLQLDDTTFGGKASVGNFAAPVIRYTLNLDEIDVDRYLPPPSDKPAAEEKVAPKGATTAAATELPLELMRSLDIDGSFTVGKVKVMNLHSDTIVATLKAKKGKFRLHPLSANLYKGGYSGNIGLDVRGKKAKLSLDEKLSGVQSGPLLKDFMGKEYVTGEASVAAKMTASGLDQMEIRRTLNGNGSFKFANGKVNGVNIGQLIRNAYALYKKQPMPKKEEKSTDFANLSGSFTVTNGVLNTKDLSALSPLFQIAGKGSVNLVKERLDLRLNTTILHDAGDVASGGVAELKGEKIPVTVKGSFSDPKFGVDVASIFEAKASAEVEKKKAEVKKEVDKQIETEKKKLEKDLENKLKNMLKF
ncbi:MAG: AsmA family protein [Pseudomonadota bacterium]